MFLLHGDAKYIDVLERAVYNSVVSGVSLDGSEFFYPNPLSSRGDYARSKWFDCSCCPTNLCRFIPSVPGYVYAIGDDGVYVNLFVEGSAQLAVAGERTVGIAQKTHYPWDGRVEITVTPELPAEQFSLYVRLPGWANNEAWPSDLYSYLNRSEELPTLQVNGQSVEIKPVKGYLVIRRAWEPGDKVVFELAMPVRRVVANEQVRADHGRVALTRGPLVFCVEEADVAGGGVSLLTLPDSAPLDTEFKADLLGGVQVITGIAPVAFTAVPYAYWSNRGKGEMAVWLKRAGNSWPGALERSRD
jgi:hypothetical protein